ncbi:MAG TPA: hypothetical protein VNT01_13565 [Symbiobacteriaceae bacterium]|nr:hypothetical protein [Symbiobacteriaceae bacterium]
MAKFRTAKGVLNLRGIEHLRTAGGSNDYEFANEVAGLTANRSGQVYTGDASRIGRNNKATTANLRGEYSR